MIRTPITLKKGELQASFLKSGDLQTLKSSQILVNQVAGNPVDGSMNNLFLRIHEGDQIRFYPLTGIESDSQVYTSDQAVRWSGQAEDVAYDVRFILSSENIWFWDIHLNAENRTVDIVYGQDIGIAAEGAVRANEAYTSQYIDHTVFDTDQHGYVVCSRQNQPQEGKFPYLQQGSIGKATGYSTDGYQFFGLSYKTTNLPEALSSQHLKNEVYQYEFAYIALQSEKVTLQGAHRFTFYGLYKAHHPEETQEPEYLEEIMSEWQSAQQLPVPEESFSRAFLSEKIGSPLKTADMTTEEILEQFPERILEEYSDGELLSFFTPSYEHIVMKKKEALSERPHGHILMNGHNDRVRTDVFTSSVYMYGIFNSQIAVGNISMNKMMTNSRNSLNVLKTSGQRIYVEIKGRFHLLTLPSFFVMGANYAKWYYKTDDEVFVITAFTTIDKKDVQLELETQSGNEYRYLVTTQITMNNNEYEVPYHVQANDHKVTFYGDAASDSNSTFPSLCYSMQFEGVNVQFGDEKMLGEQFEGGSASLFTTMIEPSAKWTLFIQGDLNGALPVTEKRTLPEASAEYNLYYKKLMNGFHLSNPHSDRDELEKFNALAYWYTHNMLVHFSSPHGLEQYGGAAWGTRDVNQGPVEYFLATSRYSTVREIILHVFSHQYEDQGDWPQWFMFDEYTGIQQADSHGDIIVWPLKVVGDYIEATGDVGILDESIPYMNRSSFTFTEKKESLFSHIKKEIDYMKAHFLHDTYLPSYDDGDWDDTLQPANQQLKKYMVSTWTVALMYQTLKKFADLTATADQHASEDIQQLVKGIKKDFHQYILTTDVIPGFLYMEDPENPEFMLHPEDQKTGIHYRLLPMQRSIISELFTPEQADYHYQLIREHLACPDGVRLMNQPANYTGGVSKHFKRAEQASNFGREIGLQYVHAHIRFVEAMAKLGVKEEAWNGLKVINPITIQEAVPNAEIRQSNAYFSSSDGKFNTRYDAQEQFHKLKDGTVPVKGGWRIYSSGPGIYMNQLISNVLGIRQLKDYIVIDPVLPEEMNETALTYELLNLPVTITYHLKEQASAIIINGQKIETAISPNPYRQGGQMIPIDQLKRVLTEEQNMIEVYIKKEEF